MQVYYGTKRILARPMSKNTWLKYSGAVKGEITLPDEPGYLVEYPDSEGKNHRDHDGYVSWSPKETFERAYRPTSALAFGHAVEALKRGEKVSREGWNGKGMFLYMEEQTTSYANMERHGAIREHFNHGGVIVKRAHIMMLTAQNDVVPWLASQSDILAHDWCIVD